VDESAIDTDRPSQVADGIRVRARTSPSRVAVADLERSITFEELDALAATLAHEIVERDTTAEAWTPILVDRSVDSAIALHAALRAGRRFAPIESSLPPSRIAEYFATLGNPSHAVVARPRHAAHLPAEVQPIGVPTESRSVGFDPAPVDPDGPAVVVFTSGSTGRPKAVVRRWSSFESVLSGALAHVSSDEPVVVAQTRPFSFGAGLRQLGIASQGHSVHILDPSSMDVETFVEHLNRLGVASMSMGTAIASTVLGHTRGVRRLPLLSEIRMGGQAAWWDLVEPLRALASTELTIVSSFGATEVGPVLQCRIGPEHPVGEGPLPLGHPPDPGRIRLEPIDGASGASELVVGQPEALGYFGDPEQTARRFVSDPDGNVWWRSGDLVSVDDDGVYYHRGRIDDMVKINGLLVEPAEAEAALHSIPGIGNATVLVHTTASGTDRLVAHLRVDDPELTPEQVHTALESRLPKHLVPSVLVRHDELPINERGKIDRQALRAVEPVRWRSSRPRRSTFEPEIFVAGQLARIIGLGDVGIDEDVWQLGLDSLGAVELCSVIAEAGLGELDPTVLLDARTVTTLVSRLLASPSEQPSNAVVLNPGGSRVSIVAFPGAGGTAFAYRSIAQALGPDQPIVVLERSGMHRRGPIERTIEDMADHALAEIDHRLAPDAPIVLMGHSAGGTPAFEVAKRLHADGRRVHLVLLDAAPSTRRSRESIPPLTERIGYRRPIDHVKAFPRLLRRRVLIRRYLRNPGRPSHRIERYEAFRLIHRRANELYGAEPADFPTTLVHVDGADAPERCAPLFTDLAVHQMSGGHLTMLHPPHVGELVGLLEPLLRSVTDRGPVSGSPERSAETPRPVGG
jgi:acyl-CoA synthetase (AMP-forming)/AMP-acid ligase II/thioesterase domain-containing protein